MTSRSESARTESSPAIPSSGDQNSLRERKKDATRRALAEAAMNLAIERGYAAVTIADITAAVGVSRRTFSNYFPGKAECIAAVTEGWFDDIVRSIKHAPAERSLDEILCDSPAPVAGHCRNAGSGSSCSFTPNPNCRRWCWPSTWPTSSELAQVIGDRTGLTSDDIRMRMLAAYAVIAGRTCLEDWVLGGRPDGGTRLSTPTQFALSSSPHRI